MDCFLYIYFALLHHTTPHVYIYLASFLSHSSLHSRACYLVLVRSLIVRRRFVSALSSCSLATLRFHNGKLYRRPLTGCVSEDSAQGLFESGPTVDSRHSVN